MANFHSFMVCETRYLVLRNLWFYTSHSASAKSGVGVILGERQLLFLQGTTNQARNELVCCYLFPRKKTLSAGQREPETFKKGAAAFVTKGLEI